MSQDNFDKDIVDAQASANLDNTDQTDGTSTKPDQEAEPETDWKEKFINSQKGALELLEDKKRLEREKEELLAKTQAAQESQSEQTMEDLYPGFEQLDPEAQANIIAFRQGIAKQVREEFLQDPAIAFTRRTFNESVFDNALNAVVSQYPELADSKEEFKNKTFNPNNVPSNIEEILKDLAKAHLFDKAREMGAKDEQSRQSRTETERASGGNRDVPTGRSLDDWTRMAQENPAKFAELSKEYHADLSTGKLRE